MNLLLHHRDMLDFDCTSYSPSPNEGLHALKERTYFDLLTAKNSSDTYFMYPHVNSTKFDFLPWQHWESGKFKNNNADYAFFMSGDCIQFFEKRKFQNLSTRCILYYSEFESKKTIHDFIELIPYLSEIDLCLCGTASILEKIKLLAPCLKAKLILKPFFDKLHPVPEGLDHDKSVIQKKTTAIRLNKLIIHTKHLLSEEPSFTPLIQLLNETFSNQPLEIVIDAIDTCYEKNATWLKDTLSSINNKLPITLVSPAINGLTTPMSQHDRKTKQSRDIFSSNYMKTKLNSLRQLMLKAYAFEDNATCSLLSLSATGDETSVNRVLYSLSKNIHCYTPDIIDYKNLTTTKIPIYYSHEHFLGTSFISSERKWKESVETNYSLDIESFVQTLNKTLTEKNSSHTIERNNPSPGTDSWPHYLNTLISDHRLSEETRQTILKKEKTPPSLFTQSDAIIKIYKNAFNPQKSQKLTLTEKGAMSLKNNKFSNHFDFNLVNLTVCKKILQTISTNKSLIDPSTVSKTLNRDDIHACQFLLKYEYLTIDNKK